MAILVTLTLGGVVLAQVIEPVAPRLTPKLQELLRDEMQSINEASQEILAAMVAGDDQRVASLARQIQDSFILRRSMTPEDKAHLMKVAPEDFVRRDREFHRISGELAQAAGAGDRPLQRKEFGRMVESCIACHLQYATDQFPGFSD